MEKRIKPKIDVESSRPSGIQIIQIDKIYDKLRIKPVSVYRCFYTKKHCKNDTFAYSSYALGELLEKTRAKCNHASICMSRH